MSESRGQPPRKKKKKKRAPKGLLSFGDNEDDVTSDASSSVISTSRTRETRKPDLSSGKKEEGSIPRRLTVNPNSLLPAPKVLTKAVLQAEAAARDSLRKEFLIMQEAVRNTEILIPFVFYDGTNIPGGIVKVKKGDHIWLFLERCRKVGAELGVSGAGKAGSGGSTKSKNDSRREWARVGVDDLMCVRGEVIIPHVSRLVRVAQHADKISALRILLFHRQPRSKFLEIKRPSFQLFKCSCDRNTRPVKRDFAEFGQQ